MVFHPLTVHPNQLISQIYNWSKHLKFSICSNNVKFPKFSCLFQFQKYRIYYKILAQFKLDGNVRKPWRDIFYLFLITYYLLLIIYYLLIITYYLLLITYHVIYHPYNGGKLHCTFPVITVEYRSQQQQQQ